MQINRSEEFKKAYKERIKKDPTLKTLYWEILEIFEMNPFHPALRTHPLDGPLEGKWAFSVDYDCRVVFHFNSTDMVTFLDIGSHDQVY